MDCPAKGTSSSLILPLAEKHLQHHALNPVLGPSVVPSRTFDGFSGARDQVPGLRRAICNRPKSEDGTGIAGAADPDTKIMEESLGFLLVGDAAVEDKFLHLGWRDDHLGLPAEEGTGKTVVPHIRQRGTHDGRSEGDVRGRVESRASMSRSFRSVPHEVASLRLWSAAAISANAGKSAGHLVSYRSWGSPEQI